MQFKRLALSAAMTAAAIGTAHAATEIQWWHSMTAVNNEWVNDLAKEFNASQNKYKIMPTYKGSYDESMTAAIAAYRAKLVAAGIARDDDFAALDQTIVETVTDAVPVAGVVSSPRSPATCVPARSRAMS